MRWTVRPASQFPAEKIEAFIDRAWRAYHVEQGHDLSYDWSSQRISLIASDDQRRIIGVASGRIRAGVGHLSELIVDHGARRCGVGGHLLEAFEARCSSAACHKLTVTTERHGPARAFYERRGWHVEAIFERDRGGLDFVRLVKFPGDQAPRVYEEGETE